MKRSPHDESISRNSLLFEGGETGGKREFPPCARARAVSFAKETSGKEACSSRLVESNAKEKGQIPLFDPNVYEEFTDRKGRPRLYHARKMLLDPRNLEDLGFSCFEDVLTFGESLFSYWRDLPEYMVIRKRWIGKKIRIPYVDKNGVRKFISMSFSQGDKDHPDEYLALKCSKRGNDVYQRRIQTRFRWLNQEIPEKKFFNIKSFQVGRAVKTSLLWVTLTWDPKRGDRVFAWENLGKDFNRFISALRSKYGKIHYLRVWESYESGFPHVHAVMLFQETEFNVFPHYDRKEGKLTFRISEKNQISELWHSHVDIQAISSLRNVFTYLKKHQEKIILGLSGSVQEGSDPIGFNVENIKGLRTLFLSWIFRKRSFSVSGHFREVLGDLISHLHNSNMERQVDLFGKVVPEWEFEFLGIFSGSELGIPSGIWVKKLSEVEVSALLDQKGWTP